MTYYGGIEIDGDQVRATVVEGSPKSARVVDFVEGQITGENAEERSESLRSLVGPVLNSKERAGLDITLSIGADRAILREISVPYTRDEMIAKTIRYESESYIFSHSVDDLLVEFIKCSETESGSRLILCGVEKDRFGNDLKCLQSAQIDPTHAEINATALATAYLNSEPKANEVNALLVQIEREHTTFLLLESGRITKVRSVWNVVRTVATKSPLLTTTQEPTESVDGGQEDRDSEIEDRFAEIERSLSGLEPSSEDSPSEDSGTPLFAVVADDEYARFEEEEGASQALTANSHALATATDPLDRIVVELERTFASHLLGGSIERLVLTGGEVRPLDAIDRLSHHFEVEATEFPLDRVELDFVGSKAEDFQVAGAVSYGLALRSAGFPATSFELRKDEFRFERRFERLMPSLTLVSLLLAAVSLLWMVGQHRQARSLAQEIAILKTTQAELYQSFFDSPVSLQNPNIHRAAKDRLKAMEGQGSKKGPRLKKYMGAMELFEDFYGAVSKTVPKVYPKYDYFDFIPWKKKGTKSQIRLYVDSTTASTAIEESLNNNTEYFDVFASPKEAKSGGYIVTVELRYKQDDN